MKNLIVPVAASLIGCLSLSAQVQVVKDAERAMKDGKPAAEVAAMIAPAAENSETAQDVKVFFIPGKAYFAEFDEMFALKQFNKLPEGGDLQMCTDLLTGYDYFMKALPLDSLPDAKGKVKPKYSKEILSTIGGHHTDFNSTAITFWDMKDYNGAYAAWDIFLSVAQNPTFKGVVQEYADTVLAEVYFNQALAAWQADRLEDALNAFDNAKVRGYSKKGLYDYSIAVATQLGNSERVFEIAKEALPLYGSEDSQYIGQIINYYLQHNQFDEAFTLIDDAISADPGNAQYYLVKGILYDNQDKKVEAREMFKKSVELDGQNAQALYNYGRALCEQAYKLADEAPLNTAEYEVYYRDQIVPVFKEAAVYLERAWEVDNDYMEPLRYLENVYYNLHDDAMQKDVQSRMGK